MDGMDIVDRDGIRIAELEAENERLQALVKALDKLLACYRLGSRPTGKLFDEIAKLRAAKSGGES